MPALYVVATPIGNLEDISLRALRILREVKLIAAEDTRKTRRLLGSYDIKTPMVSFHEYSRAPKISRILEHLSEGDVALVSEAGMPGVSDPGYELVTAAIQQGFKVVPVPGPSVVTTALAVSGLSADRFTFLGFLPRKASNRRSLLESVAEESATLVAFEAPHRLVKSLSDIRLIFGDRKIAVCRELTKLYEEVFRGTISQAMEHFTEPRGEFTLVIEGKRDQGPAEVTADIERQLIKMHRSGVPAREAIKKVAGETKLSRKELYQAWLRLG